MGCTTLEGTIEPDAFVPLIQRHLQDFQTLSGPARRRRAIDLEAEVQECLPLFQVQAGRQNVRVIVKSQTHGKLARAEMRPELGRCLLVLLFENALKDVTPVRGGRKSEGASRNSDGRHITLTVWATDERAGVDCRVAGSAGGTNGRPHPGLTLVKELCVSLGGELTVQAGRGEGQTYRLDFRRKQARATR